MPGNMTVVPDHVAGGELIHGTLTEPYRMCRLAARSNFGSTNVMAAPEAKTDLESATTKTSGSAVAPELTKMILLHTNDTHGRAAESGSSWGSPRSPPLQSAS